MLDVYDECRSLCIFNTLNLYLNPNKQTNKLRMSWKWYEIEKAFIHLDYLHPKCVQAIGPEQDDEFHIQLEKNSNRKIQNLKKIRIIPSSHSIHPHWLGGPTKTLVTKWVKNLYIFDGMFLWLVFPDFYPNENQVQHLSRLCVSTKIDTFLWWEPMGPVGIFCRFYRDKNHHQATFCEAFLLILSNHLKQIWQVTNHCFPLPLFGRLLKTLYFWTGGVRYSLTFSAPELWMVGTPISFCGPAYFQWL